MIAHRWLYHLTEDLDHRGPLAPPSLEREGFVHLSFADQLADTARLHFAPGARLVALRVDPRRIGVRLTLDESPRGPMPHAHGPICNEAIVARIDLAHLGDAPDLVTGTRVAVVAFDGMTLLDLVGAHDPLSRIASMGVDPTCRVDIVSATGPSVWAQGGARLVVDAVRPPLEGYDVVFVPGGLGTRALVHDDALIAWLSAFPANRICASVCTGSLLWARTGRLRGRLASTHLSALDDLASLGAVVAAERVVIDPPFITGGGVTCALDVGLTLVRTLAGDAAHDRIAAQMQFAPPRPS